MSQVTQSIVQLRAMQLLVDAINTEASRLDHANNPARAEALRNLKPIFQEMLDAKQLVQRDADRVQIQLVLLSPSQWE